MIRALFALCLTVPILAQESGTRVEDPLAAALESIQPEKIREHLSYLASDELEGRLASHPGNEKALDYAARHLEKLGLAPLGDWTDEEKKTRGYRQAFTAGRRKKYKTANLVAFVEGADEKLKSECVVVGAHIDHVGTADQEPNVGRMPKRGNDRIWNGADDNGSGATTLMEVARALASLRGRMKRSVVIVWFNAEEWGLLGAAHYCSHPPPEFPMEQTAAMVNMDMVGRNPDDPVQVTCAGSCAEWTGLLEEAGKGLDLELAPTTANVGGSDHMPFLQRKVPAVHFFTGFHANYHRPDDHVDKIDFDHAAKVGRCVTKLVYLLANLAERPKYVNQGGARAGGGPRLGITPGAEVDEERAKEIGLSEEEGGLAIDSVEDGSVADRAGILAGDILLEFNGVKLPRSGALRKVRALLRKIKEGDEAPVVVWRDGKRVELKAQFGKPRIEKPKAEEKPPPPSEEY